MELPKAKRIEQIIEAESAKPRIGKIVFYGVCDFCGEKIDITSKIDFNRKIELVNNYGTEKIGSEWVCSREIPLQNCPFCKNIPF